MIPDSVLEKDAKAARTAGILFARHLRMTGICLTTILTILVPPTTDYLSVDDAAETEAEEEEERQCSQIRAYRESLGL